MISFCDAPVIILSTIGAPPKWVMSCFSINSNIFFTSIALKQTVFPFNIGIVHGYPHPLQWNIGTTVKKFNLFGIFQATALPVDIK